MNQQAYNKEHNGTQIIILIVVVALAFLLRTCTDSGENRAKQRQYNEYGGTMR